MKHALITGITGQDGSYLAEFLLDEGYGSSGWSAAPAGTFERIDHLARPRRADRRRPLDEAPARRALEGRSRTRSTTWRPRASCATRSTSRVLTADVTAWASALLEAVRQLDPTIRFYQASSLGDVRQGRTSRRRREDTPFHPRSPYGVAKVYGHWLTRQLPRGVRPVRLLAASCSTTSRPAAGCEFVTRKVTDAAARIKLGLQDELPLGNLDAQRDWGFAGDYVARHVADAPAGRGRRLRDRHRRDPHGPGAVGIAFEPRRPRLRAVRRDRPGLPPAEVDVLADLRGDLPRREADLGWKPTVGFEALIPMMVDADLAPLKANPPTDEPPA